MGARLQAALEAYNHDLKIRFFRHKQRGTRLTIATTSSPVVSYLMRHYKPMIKASGLWSAGCELETDDDDDDDDDNDDDDDDDDTKRRAPA
jgi:hypothetical protein